MATVSPARTVIDAPSSAFTPPKETPTSSTRSSSGAVGAGAGTDGASSVASTGVGGCAVVRADSRRSARPRKGTTPPGRNSRAAMSTTP